MDRREVLTIALLFALLIICIITWVISTQFGYTAQESLSEIAADGFKTVLGALIGALSLMAGKKSER